MFRLFWHWRGKSAGDIVSSLTLMPRISKFTSNVLSTMCGLIYVEQCDIIAHTSSKKSPPVSTFHAHCSCHYCWAHRELRTRTNHNINKLTTLRIKALVEASVKVCVHEVNLPTKIADPHVAAPEEEWTDTCESRSFSKQKCTLVVDCVETQVHSQKKAATQFILLLTSGTIAMCVRVSNKILHLKTCRFSIWCKQRSVQEKSPSMDDSLICLIVYHSGIIILGIPVSN
eukprot:c47131_g1_i1 orf=212-898(-)